jgi:hypothetical protein
MAKKKNEFLEYVQPLFEELEQAFADRRLTMQKHPVLFKFLAWHRRGNRGRKMTDEQKTKIEVSFSFTSEGMVIRQDIRHANLMQMLILINALTKYQTNMTTDVLKKMGVGLAEINVEGKVEKDAEL